MATNVCGSQDSTQSQEHFSEDVPCRISRDGCVDAVVNGRVDRRDLRPASSASASGSGSTTAELVAFAKSELARVAGHKRKASGPVSDSKSVFNAACHKVGGDVPSVVEADGSNALYHFAFTWSLWDKGAGRPDPPTESKFSDMFVQIREALVASGYKYIFQLEKGAGGRLHYQGYIHASKGKKQRSGTVAKALSDAGLHGVHVSAASTAGKESLRRYCMKDQTRVAGPWKDTDKVKFTPEEIARLRIIDVKSLWPWQQSVYNALMVMSNDRTINWLVDWTGNVGKSSFVKAMYVHGMAVGLGFSDSKDCMKVVTDLPEYNAYIFDLTRTKPANLSMSDTYACMEQIKNGYMVNTKFHSKVSVAPPAHIWVFANAPPQFGAMSHDRWKVWGVKNQTLYEMTRQEIEEKADEDEFKRLLAAARAAKRQKKIEKRVTEYLEQEAEYEIERDLDK